MLSSPSSAPAPPPPWLSLCKPVLPVLLLAFDVRKTIISLLMPNLCFWSLCRPAQNQSLCVLRFSFLLELLKVCVTSGSAVALFSVAVTMEVIAGDVRSYYHIILYNIYTLFTKTFFYWLYLLVNGIVVFVVPHTRKHIYIYNMSFYFVIVLSVNRNST